MVKVYAFPPVSCRGTEWTVDYPISRSRSIITGRRYASSIRRARHKVRIEVGGLGVDDLGAGYVEVLKRLLVGGENLVRINAMAPYRGPQVDIGGGATRVEWTDGGVDVDWTDGGTETIWFTGTLYTATRTTSAGMPAVYAERLPPNTIIARPSDRFEFIALDGNSQYLTAIQKVVTNANGQATIRVVEDITAEDGQLRFGNTESAVFEPDDIPRAMTPVNGDWIFKWEFTEVFEDETDGFVELNPWS